MGIQQAVVVTQSYGCFQPVAAGRRPAKADTPVRIDNPRRNHFRHDHLPHMTIEDDSVIDAAGLNKESGELHLSMFAPSPWERTSLLQLESKINRYLGAIESGELLTLYPSAVGKAVVIDVYCKFRPTELATRFFDHAGSVCEEYGAKLRHLHDGKGYADDES